MVAIALGGAGLVTASSGGTLPAARPELTGVEDARATVRLDAIEEDLGALSAKVETLGTQARGALSALVGSETDVAETAIQTGDALLLEIGLEAAAIRDALEATPYVGTPAADLHVSPEVQARYARLLDGLDATRQLDTSWSRLTAGALSATRLSTSLAEHDRLVGEAAARGRQGKYKEALVFLTDAADELTAERKMRDVLANTVDVSVLDQWLERNTTYDKALRALYVALDSSRRQDHRRRARRAGRRTGGAPAAAAGFPCPDRDHRGDRQGRDERRGHRHRGGQGPPRRRPRPDRHPLTGRPADRADPAGTLTPFVHPPPARPNIEGPASRFRRIRRS